MNTATMEQAGQLETAIITVQYVNEPKPGKKYGSIKDTDGNYWPDKRGDFVEGGTYELKFRREDGGFPNIVSAQPAQKPAPRAQAARAAPQPQQRTAPVQQSEPHAPQNGNGYYRPTSPADKQSMFVCSQMNALISSRQIVPLNEDTIATHIVMLTRGYRIAMRELEQDGPSPV